MKSMTKINWVTEYSEKLIGNAYGYRVHNDTLKEYVSKIAEITQDTRNTFAIFAPEFYKQKLPGINFIFTMFEGTTLPEKYQEYIKRADYLFTPSTWVKKMFSQYFSEEKIFVVNHGVSHDFTYKKRHYPTNKPFRYLWVGAPNPRKGWEEVIHCWKNLFQNDKDIELYIKTTLPGDIQRNRNIICDGRNLPRKDLIKLYHSSHCFLFPSRGEGFGLTLAEAMRTGLPCIATNYSGQTDFFDDKVGYPIGYKMGKGIAEFFGDKLKVETDIAYPFVDEMAMHMVKIREHYKEALKIGERASKRILGKFTWTTAAAKLVGIIEENGDASSTR